MADSYEREGFARVLRTHRIVKPAQRRLPLVPTARNPVDRHADRRPTHHRQVQRRYRMPHPTAVFSARHVQPQMQAGLDAPVVPICVQHRRRSQFRSRTGTDQRFGFLCQVAPVTAPHRPLQARRLRHPRETRRLGGQIKAGQTPRFESSPVELDLLRDVRRGKRRARRAHRTAG